MDSSAGSEKEFNIKINNTRNEKEKFLLKKRFDAIKQQLTKQLDKQVQRDVSQLSKNKEYKRIQNSLPPIEESIKSPLSVSNPNRTF